MATPRTHTLPAGTMTSPIVQKAQPTSSYIYYDVLDTLAKFDAQPVAFAPIMRSIAWSIDTSCINAARNVLFTLYKDAELEESTDPFGDFCQEVHEVVSAASWYADEAGDNPVKDLALLLSIRNQWHDTAQAACASNDRDYSPKSLRELLESEKPRAVGSETKEKLGLLATRMADGDEAKAALRLKQLVEREEFLAIDRATGNRKLIGTILQIIDSVSRYASEDTRFDQLSVPTQRRLTSGALNAVERAMVDVSKQRSLSTISYMLILDIYEEVTAEINQVLKTRLADDGDMTNMAAQSETASLSYQQLKQRRMQKAAAAADLS